MILQNFDNGWGGQFAVKQVEQQLIDKLTKNLQQDSSRTVIINSTWYTTDYHQTVLEYLRNNPCDCVVLVAMLDATIPQLDWYQEFDFKKIGVGYYSGEYNIDFWSLILNQFYQPIDCDILTNHQTIDTAYMCLNRKPHWHRLKLYHHLTQLNLLDHGLVSMGSDTGQARLLKLDNGYTEIAPNPGPEQYGMSNDIVSLGHINNWTRHFLNIVTETVWDINRHGFVSEKIYKPIVGCRPFLVYDPDGAVSWLTQRGFENYTNDFKDISALDLSQGHNIPAFLKVLCTQSPAYWQAKYLALKDKIMYNKNHFTEYVKQQQLLVEKGIACQI
jgi:hypothetical protein